MHFSYDLESDSVHVQLRDTEVVLEQFLTEGNHLRGMVFIDGDGKVQGFTIGSPSTKPWPISTLLTYQIDINDAYIITVLAERYRLFQFEFITSEP